VSAKMLDLKGSMAVQARRDRPATANHRGKIILPANKRPLIEKSVSLRPRAA